MPNPKKKDMKKNDAKLVSKNTEINKPKKDNRFRVLENMDKIGEIPVYYGFYPKQSPSIKKIDLDNSKTLIEGDFAEYDDNEKDRLPLHVEEKVALLRMYHEENMYNLTQPVMLYFKEPFKGSLKKGQQDRYCDLEIIGNSTSIAEVTLIQTARMMLEEEDYKNTYVEINSIGDKDSIARFTRDLTNHYRKHINNMHAECRELFKKDPFELLSCDNEKCRKINSEAPKPMDFLSEKSRNHLEEILEYLEALEIPYMINNHLIGNKRYCTETIFTIVNADYGKDGEKKDNKNEKEKKVLAVGVRYDSLSKKIGMKKEVEGVGISLLIKNKYPELRKDLNKTKNPFASFVQLSFESKLLSLKIIEELRKVKIPLYLSLSKDRLGAQVSLVEKTKAPYSLIMGKKEAVDKTIIVRNTSTHAQDIVPILDLPKFMKKLDEQI